jgi:hypothetical protein
MAEELGDLLDFACPTEFDFNLSVLTASGSSFGDIKGSGRASPISSQAAKRLAPVVLVSKALAEVRGGPGGGPGVGSWGWDRHVQAQSFYWLRAAWSQPYCKGLDGCPQA